MRHGRYVAFRASDFQEAFRRRNRQTSFWQLLVRDYRPSATATDHPLQKPTTQPGQVWYIMDWRERSTTTLRVELFHATCRREGSPGKIKKLSVGAELPSWPDRRDRAILEMLVPRSSVTPAYSSWWERCLLFTNASYPKRSRTLSCHAWRPRGDSRGYSIRPCRLKKLASVLGRWTAVATASANHTR